MAEGVHSLICDRSNVTDCISKIMFTMDGDICL